MKIGCHVSIAGGVQNAPRRAADLGCEVFQIFTRSPQGGKAPEITPEIIKTFKEEMRRWKQENCYVHTPYYINFASSNPRIRKASVKIVKEELGRGSLLGAKYIMTHLGSSGELERKEALTMVAKGIKEIMKGYKDSAELLLEISAGAGHVMGNTFEELDYIIKKSSKKVSVCIDSAHMFASGYDIKTGKGFERVIKKIKSTIGIGRIKLIHSNDSKIELGGYKDRHDHMGHGKIGVEGFENLIGQFKDLDFILETEHDKVEEDIQKLKFLRGKILS